MAKNSTFEGVAAVHEIGGYETAGDRLSVGLVDENEVIADLKCLISRTRMTAYRPVTMSSVNAEVVLWRAIRAYCRSDEEFAGVRRSFEKIYIAHIPTRQRGPVAKRIAEVTKLLQGVKL